MHTLYLSLILDLETTVDRTDLARVEVDSNTDDAWLTGCIRDALEDMSFDTPGLTADRRWRVDLGSETMDVGPAPPRPPGAPKVDWK